MTERGRAGPGGAGMDGRGEGRGSTARVGADGEMNAGGAGNQKRAARQNERAPRARCHARCIARGARVTLRTVPYALLKRVSTYGTLRTYCFECFEKGCEGAVEKVRKKGNNNEKKKKLSFSTPEG